MAEFLNWLLVIVGGALILFEVLLGAVSGFDFALIGSAVLLGGVLGLFFHSPIVGVAAGGVLSLVYVFFGRSRIRRRLHRPDVPSNTDYLIGKPVRVSERITADRPGRIRFEGEEWRAILETAGAPALEEGRTARVARIEGVTVVVTPESEGVPS